MTHVAAPATVAAIAVTAAVSVFSPSTSPPPGESTGPAKTIPGVPPTVPGEAPPGASIDQLVAAAQRFLGPSDDLVGPFAGVVDVPEGIPTPAGSTVTDMILTVHPSRERDDSYSRGVVSFTSTAIPADIAELYATLLPAAGYPQVHDGTERDEYGTSRQMEFAIPTARNFIAGITVIVNETSVDDEPAIHQLSWYADADADALGPFIGWTPGLPLPPDAAPIEATLSTSNYVDVSSVNIETRYELPTSDPTAINDEFERQLPVAGYARDVDLDDDDITAMTGPGLPQVVIYWNDAYPNGTTATVHGRVRV